MRAFLPPTTPSLRPQKLPLIRHPRLRQLPIILKRNRSLLLQLFLSSPSLGPIHVEPHAHAALVALQQRRYATHHSRVLLERLLGLAVFQFAASVVRILAMNR